MRVVLSALVCENESADMYFLKILMCYKNCGTHNGTNRVIGLWLFIKLGPSRMSSHKTLEKNIAVKYSIKEVLHMCGLWQAGGMNAIMRSMK